MEQKMEDDMETGVIGGLHEDPGMQTSLDWALKYVNVTYIGPAGSLGIGLQFTQRMRLKSILQSY